MNVTIAIYTIAVVGFAVGWITGFVCFALLAPRPVDAEDEA